MTLDPLDIQGKVPALAGTTCDDLLCLEYWHEGALVDPANVIFIRADGIWHKLSFDSGIIFWTSGAEPIKSFEAPEIASVYRQVDLGKKYRFAGRRIDGCEAAAIDGGSKVSIAFQGGGSIVFQSIDDVTSYVAA